MSFLTNIKIWIHSLFHGMSDANDLIQGQSIDIADKQIGVHQNKNTTQRVSPALLRGEVTKEVVDLRYRDYMVSEGSRYYNANGEKTINNGILNIPNNIPTKFSGLNHEICNSIQESKVDSSCKHTLKFEYTENVKYQLDKYCEHFSVDGDYITLYFNAIPNRNIITSKAFCNYINKLITSEKFGGEYLHLSEIWFVTYKITKVPNYTKFRFLDLVLSEAKINKNELILKYKASYVKTENLLEKYTSEDLKKKYEVKAEKHLQEDLVVFDIQNRCEVCGKEIPMEDGIMNKSVIGKFCCGECLVSELIKMKNQLEHGNSN